MPFVTYFKFLVLVDQQNGRVNSSCEDFRSSIRVCLPNFTIWEFSNSYPVRVENIFLSISEFDGLDSTLFYLLNRPIREDAFFVSILKYALNCAVREAIVYVKRFLITYIISLVLSGKCFSIWLFENLNT